MARTLYDYYRSTASYRVRIALHYKSIPHEHHEVHLVKAGGEQHTQAYRDINPQGLVPSLQEDDTIITQSLAIIEYLEDTHPEPALLPADPTDRAWVRSLAYMIACDIHPLNNLRVLQFLKERYQADEEATLHWYHHWLTLGFDALEQRLQQSLSTGDCCFGNSISLADVCLIPQIYNAHRFHFDMAPYPILQRINTHCLSLDYFKRATPEANQANRR